MLFHNGTAIKSVKYKTKRNRKEDLEEAEFLHAVRESSKEPLEEI